MSDVSSRNDFNPLSTAQVQSKATKESELAQRAQQISSQDTVQEEESEAVNPFILRQKKSRETLETRRGKVKEPDAPKGVLKAVDNSKESADQKQRDNSELDSRALMSMKNRLKQGSSSKDVMDLVEEFYSDPALQDEVLEFLEETTAGELKEAVKKAREELKGKFGKEIAAGRNIGGDSRAFGKDGKTGIGTPSELRGLYKDITGKPREGNALFDELSKTYPYDKLKSVVSFLLHSLGSDMKSKGPSIPKGELFRLLTETRVLQSILGVYRFFESRMHLLQGLFEKYSSTMPKTITFELLSKLFMSLVAERYPSSMKVLKLAGQLGLENDILGQISVFEQMRDGTRGVAPRIYKSIKHRWDLLAAILEALDQLEDSIEEEDDEEGGGGSEQ